MAALDRFKLSSSRLVADIVSSSSWEMKIFGHTPNSNRHSYLSSSKFQQDSSYELAIYKHKGN